jgi:hypothetical protein
MKTKWGSCNHGAGHIRLNTELVKKPRDLLEYVVVHEMVHLIESTHNDRFINILDKHYPTWQEAWAELNDLSLAAEAWKQQTVFLPFSALGISQAEFESATSALGKPRSIQLSYWDMLIRGSKSKPRNAFVV